MDLARKPRSRAVRLAPLALGGLVVAVAVASLARPRAAAARVVDHASVWTSKVERGDLVREVPVQGTLVPERVQWLSAASSARVARIAVRPGALVDPDTIVLELDNAELELARLQAEQQAANARAALVHLDVTTRVAAQEHEALLVGLRSDLRDAEHHASVADKLAAAGLITDVNYQEIQNKVRGLKERLASETSRAAIMSSGRGQELEAQRAEIAQLSDIARFRRQQIAALHVRAGVHGVVSEIPLESGQWVATGALLAKVAEPDRLKAEVKVAEGSARELHRGLVVRFESESGLIRGHIDRADPNVVGGTVKLTVVLDDALPPGARVDQTITGFVEIETLRDVLTIHRPAGARDGETVKLYRLEPDGARAHRTTLTLGRGSSRRIEVQTGVGAGDTVIISDTSTWEPTDDVRLQ